MRGIRGFAQRHKIVGTASCWHRIGHIDERLRRLSNGYVGNHFVRDGINGRNVAAIFQRNVHARAVTGRPDAVRKIADRNRGHKFRRCSATEGLYLVRAANGHVSKLAVTIVGKIHVVGDRSGLQQRLLLKRRPGVEHLRFAGIFERDPDFVILRAQRNVGAERAALRQSVDHRVTCRVDHIKLRHEAGADESVMAVRAEDGHARTVGGFNAPRFFHLCGINHGDIIFSAHGDPELMAVRREERFMR